MTLDLLGFDPEFEAYCMIINATQSTEIETYDMIEQAENIEDYDAEDEDEDF